MIGEHGRRMKWKTLFVDKTKGKLTDQKIQIVTREDGTKTLQVFLPIHPISMRYKCVNYEPSYLGLKMLIFGMVEIYGKEEVERELGIRILGGEEKQNE